MYNILHSWTQEAAYKKAMKIIKSLKVVNDTAERRIFVPIINFNSSLTRREDEKQILLLMVEMHRTRHPQCIRRKGSSSGSKMYRPSIMVVCDDCINF